MLRGLRSKPVLTNCCLDLSPILRTRHTVELKSERVVDIREERTPIFRILGFSQTPPANGIFNPRTGFATKSVYSVNPCSKPLAIKKRWSALLYQY